MDDIYLLNMEVPFRNLLIFIVRFRSRARVQLIFFDISSNY